MRLVFSIAGYALCTMPVLVLAMQKLNLLPVRPDSADETSFLFKAAAAGLLLLVLGGQLGPGAVAQASGMP